MKKEIITKENCKIDLNSYIKEELSYKFFGCFIISIIVLCIAVIIYFARYPKSIIFYIAFTVPVVYLLYAFILFFIRKNRIKNEEFLILTDRLANIGKDYDYSHPFYGRIMFTYLEFSSYGKYFYHAPFYSWTENYKDKTYSYRVLSNRSITDEEFYLVAFKSKPNKPLIVYNKKLFDYEK